MTIVTKGLHIINGLSAAGSWKQAHKKTDRLLINQDILSCGPTPSCSDLYAWEKTRLEFLRSLYPEWPDVDFYGLESDLLHNAGRLAESEDIYLWLSTGLEEQLLLLFLIHLADLVGANPEYIKLIQYESLATRKFPIRMLGELNPEQMKNHPKPRELTRKDIDYCRSAWAALTSPDAEALNVITSNDVINMPHVKAALECVRRRFPDRKTGLTYWDRQLLPKIQKRGPSVALIIGHTICGDLADADCIGDGYLFYRLRELGNPHLPMPLVQLEGSLRNIRETTAELTNFGLDVLSGKSSSYPENPIDEWIGGCHLSSSDGNLWFFENGQLENAE